MSPDEIRQQRGQLRISRLELARRARVSRYRLYSYEVAGSPPLTADEVGRIREVLHQEGPHIRQVLAEAGI